MAEKRHTTLGLLLCWLDIVAMFFYQPAAVTGGPDNNPKPLSIHGH